MREKRVLIVDPDNEFRVSLANSLRSGGYLPVTSHCLTSAIQKMVETNFPCVVVDTDLPEIRGYEAVSVFRRIDPSVSIIMTTERNTRELEAKVREQNVYYYFIKSFGVDELKAAIDSLFSRIDKNGGKKMEAKNGKGKILIIDDDPDFRSAVTTILESADYEVIAADNPAQGEEKAISEEPDLILLDIMMDSLFDRFSLCNSFKTSKKSSKLCRTPIIFVSAVKNVVGSRFRFKADEQGMIGPDDYIDKPVKGEDLLSRIEKLVA
jgi:DNA-binding response OmpR family regulator